MLYDVCYGPNPGCDQLESMEFGLLILLRGYLRALTQRNVRNNCIVMSVMSELYVRDEVMSVPINGYV